MPDPVVVPVLPDPAPPEPRSWRTQGRGRATIDADWSRWPLVQPEALCAALVSIGVVPR